MRKKFVLQLLDFRSCLENEYASHPHISVTSTRHFANASLRHKEHSLLAREKASFGKKKLHFAKKASVRLKTSLRQKASFKASKKSFLSKWRYFSEVKLFFATWRFFCRSDAFWRSDAFSGAEKGWPLWQNDALAKWRVKMTLL